MFWVISVYYNIRNTLPKSGTFLLGHPVYVHTVSQEECARLWEGVPYVKVYRYNPKHLYPKLNGYGGNGQRKVGLVAVPNTATCTADPSRDNASGLERGMQCSFACVTLCAVSHVTSPRGFLMYSAYNPKDK